jgi:hypothetical protein
MNKKINATASATLSTSSYVAPKAEMLGVKVEGVLCTSGSIEGWIETVIEEW